MSISSTKLYSKKLLTYLSGVYLYLYLHRPFKKHTITRATNNKDIVNEIFKIRYFLYCVQDRLLNPKDYPDGVEFNNDDDRSEQFAVFNPQSEIVGTFRLIKPNGRKFPTEQEFGLSSIFTNNSIRHKTVEISRFMVRSEYRKTMLLLDMLKTIYLFSKRNGIEYWHGCAEQWFINTLNKVIGPLRIIDKPKFYYNAINYPFLFKVSEIEFNVKNKNSLIYYFFVHQTNNITI